MRFSPLTAVAALTATLALLALGGCARDPSPAPAAAVVGEIADPSIGANTLRAETDAGAVLAVARVDGRGRFSLRLPDERAVRGELAPLRPPAPNALCRSSVRLDGPGVRTLTLAGFETEDGRAVSGLRFVPNPAAAMYDVRGVTWVYADRPAALAGRYECTLRPRVGPAEQTVVNYDVRLKAGWNAVRSDVETTFVNEADLFLTAERVTNAAGPVTLYAAPSGDGQDTLNLPPLNVFLHHP